MSQETPLKPAPSAPFEIMYLDPNNPKAEYRVWKKVSEGKKEKIEWAVRQVAIRELNAVGKRCDFRDQIQWILDEARQCPYSRIAILRFLVEPIGTTVPVDSLYDDMDRTVIDELIEDFTTSSIGERIIAAILNSQNQSQQNLPSTVKETESSKTARKNKKTSDLPKS